MPAADHSLALRGAVVKALKECQGVAAIVPPARVLAGQPAELPAWPWVRVSAPIWTPDESQGFAGGLNSFTVSGFADDSTQAMRLGRRIVACLDETRPALDPDEAPAGAHVVELVAERMEVMPDTGRAGGYHALCSFTATTAEAR